MKFLKFWFFFLNINSYLWKLEWVFFLRDIFINLVRSYIKLIFLNKWNLFKEYIHTENVTIISTINKKCWLNLYIFLKKKTGSEQIIIYFIWLDKINYFQIAGNYQPNRTDLTNRTEGIRFGLTGHDFFFVSPSNMLVLYSLSSLPCLTGSDAALSFRWSPWKPGKNLETDDCL